MWMWAGRRARPAVFHDGGKFDYAAVFRKIHRRAPREIIEREPISLLDFRRFFGRPYWPRRRREQRPQPWKCIAKAYNRHKNPNGEQCVLRKQLNRRGFGQQKHHANNEAADDGQTGSADGNAVFDAWPCAESLAPPKDEDQQGQDYQDAKVPVFGKHQDLPSSGIEQASISAGDR
jgi:hypothetical protein